MAEFLRNQGRDIILTSRPCIKDCLSACYLNKSSNVIVFVNTLEFFPGFKPNVVTSVGCIDDRLLT